MPGSRASARPCQHAGGHSPPCRQHRSQRTPPLQALHPSLAPHRPATAGLQRCHTRPPGLHPPLFYRCTQPLRASAHWSALPLPLQLPAQDFCRKAPLSPFNSTIHLLAGCLARRSGRSLARAGAVGAPSRRPSPSPTLYPPPSLLLRLPIVLVPAAAGQRADGQTASGGRACGGRLEWGSRVGAVRERLHSAAESCAAAASPCPLPRAVLQPEGGGRGRVGGAKSVAEPAAAAGAVPWWGRKWSPWCRDRVGGKVRQGQLGCALHCARTAPAQSVGLQKRSGQAHHRAL